MSEVFDFTGKVVLITGGSGGIGKAIATGFARHGADIALAARTLSKLESAAEEVRKTGRKVKVFPADVTDEKSIYEMVDAVVREFGRVDILVNAAGIANRKPAEVISVMEWKQVNDFNSLGTFICCQAVGKVMIKQNGGRIINISSIRGRFGTSLGGVAYGPSKGAIDALTRTLACEWGKYHIYVNAVAPSLVVTELTRAFLADPERVKITVSRIPLGRMGELEDVVGPVLFLGSPAANFITGQVIRVDGGNSAGFM